MMNTPKKRILFALALLSAAALFAVAGFQAIGWLRGGLGVQNTQVELIPAPEIPTSPPDLVGTAVALEEHGLMVMEGTPEMVSVKPGKNGEVIMESRHTGLAMEVLVTNDTVIYLDTTFDGPTPPKEGKIQQQVRPVVLSQLEKGGRISVWGSQRGERLIAEKILYKQPAPAQAQNQ